MSSIISIDKVYKPSKFNLIFESNGQNLLFNSYRGIKSIHKVSIKNKEKVLLLLSSNSIVYYDDNLLNYLIEKGFIVPQDVDEDLLREKLMEEVCGKNHLHLLVYVTNNCNFRCKYCALDFSAETIQNDTKEGIIEFIRKNINNYSGVTIDWFGGEPTLEINSIKYISQKVQEICRKAKKPYSGLITTNGYLLTPENVSILVESNVLEYMVTIDGVKQTHDNQRILKNGGGTFDKIIKNLLWMKDNIKSKTLNIVIRTNMTREIFRNLDSYYTVFNNLFGDDNRFSLFVRPASDWGGERVKSFHNSLLDDNELKKMYKSVFEHTHGMLFERNIGDIDISSATCSAAYKNKFTVGINGDVYKCDDAIEELKVGHLNKNGVMELDDYKCAIWERGYRKYSNKCENCFFSCSCFFGACPKAILYKGENPCVCEDIDVEEIVKYAATVLEGVKEI